MAKKFNQKLLNEELKKFRLLSEYSFYTEEPKKNDDDDLILGSSLEEADEDPNATPDAGDDSKTAANKGTDAPEETTDAGGDSENLFGTDTGDTGGDQTNNGTEDTGNQADTSTDTGTDMVGGVDDASAGTEETGDDVEVDVTQLVKGSEEATQAASDASQKTSELLSKFNDLEQRVAAMDSITSKIDALEKEIVKRNPTPVEKLEMRSMDSFPYNIKLTDYWKDVDGYDANGNKTEPNEYVLTKDDVDGVVDSSIKKTFDVPEDYEEEDIDA